MEHEAAIVTIGTELVEGLRTDTNGPQIARRLARLGFSIGEIVSVADGQDILATVYHDLCERYTLVVSTGGLGPTHDDVTRVSAARALGLGMHEDIRIRERLDRWASKYSTTPIYDEILSQAQVIDGAEVLDAIAGTAPGQLVPTPAGELLLLPGPPKECMPIFEVYANRLPDAQETSVDFSIFGLTESEVQHLVQPCIANYPLITFTVLASPIEVHAILLDEGQGSTDLNRAAEAVRSVLGDCIFSECGDSLAKVVIDLAVDKNLHIACAESCTGGRIASALTDVPGASEVFLGGIVSYANTVKEAQLGVSSSDLSTFGAVSSQVATAMAFGARERLCADLAVSTTGIAGPGGGSVEKPVGTVWFGISDENGTEALCRLRPGTRDAVRGNSASAALDLLRRRMLGLPLVSSVIRTSADFSESA